MTTPALGEFLQPAAGHLNAAVSSPSDLPDEARDAAIQELGRVVTALARYLRDLPLPDEFDPALDPMLKPAARAGAEARQALQWAAASLLPDPGRPPGDAGSDAPHPVVRHLAAAADLLAAGADLLHTHFTGPPAAHTARSYWAPVILSWPVTSALLDEVAACARLLAPWTAHLSVTGPYQPGGRQAAASAGLHIASRWLWAAGAAVHAAQQDHPPAAEARDLLAAIPLNAPPDALLPAEPEPVPGLCRGITITAERLRHAASTASARQAPATTSVSWRRDALASAITTHSSAFILRMLTQRAGQLGLDAALQDQLRTAAIAMNQAWPAWYKAARQWDVIATGHHPPGSITPVAAEMGELALRTGRLARRDPHWTPARTGLGLIRDPASLAPSPADVPAIITAVHQATDALVRIAAEDRQAIRDAGGNRRLYIPAGLLPARPQTPYSHVVVPWHRTRRLLATYTGAIHATTRALTTLDTLATTTATPSQILSHIRALSPARAIEEEPPEPATQEPGQKAHWPDRPEPGTLGRAIQDLAITDLATLLRAAAIDKAACDLTAQASAQTQRRATISRTRPATDRPHPGR